MRQKICVAYLNFGEWYRCRDYSVSYKWNLNLTLNCVLSILYINSKLVNQHTQLTLAPYPLPAAISVWLVSYCYRIFTTFTRSLHFWSRLILQLCPLCEYVCIYLFFHLSKQYFWTQLTFGNIYFWIYVTVLGNIVVAVFFCDGKSFLDSCKDVCILL